MLKETEVMKRAKKNIIFRAFRRIWRIFFPMLSHEKQVQRDRQRDYKYLTFHGVETEPGYVTLYGNPIIHKHPQSRIVIGNGVTLCSDSNYNFAGVNHPTILATTTPDAEIIIHDGAKISGCSIVAEKRIEIGNNAFLGANSNVYDNDFHPIDADARIADVRGLSAPVTIGNKCWLASNVTVLKGVTIGDEAVVGAMSLVTKDIPAKVIAGGVPAKVIRKM